MVLLLSNYVLSQNKHRFTRGNCLRGVPVGRDIYQYGYLRSSISSPFFRQIVDLLTESSLVYTYFK